MTTTKWGNLSPAQRQAFSRATDLGYATAGGDKLIQDYINRTIQQLTLREWGLTNFLDRRPGSGSQAIVNRRGAPTALAGWIADNAEPTSVVGDYTQKAFPYQTLATRGTVSRKLMAMGRSYSDVLADEMAAKAEDFMFQLEETGLRGRTASDSVPDGFLTLVNDLGTQQVVAAPPAPGSSTAAVDLSLAKLDETIDRVKGNSIRSDLAIVLSPTMGRILNGLLQAQQQFTNMVEVAAGFMVNTYAGIPVIQSTGMPDTCNAIAAAGYITDASKMWGDDSGTGTDGVIMVINKRYCWIEELTPMTVLPLAKDSSANDKFDMFMDCSFVLSNTYGAALLEGLKTS